MILHKCVLSMLRMAQRAETENNNVNIILIYLGYLAAMITGLTF